HSGVGLLLGLAQYAGLDCVATYRRPIHGTKRSFAVAGRRATEESIVVLQKPPGRRRLKLVGPAYRLWDYEVVLRQCEIDAILSRKLKPSRRRDVLLSSPIDRIAFRRLAFTRAVVSLGGNEEKTWQAILENGAGGGTGARKDPKYGTHGIH